MICKKLLASALALAMTVSTFAFSIGATKDSLLNNSEVNAAADQPYASGELSGLSVQQIVKEMGIGWNLGNSLDCSGINFKDVSEKDKNLSEWYETGWSNPVTTKAMIDKVKKEGFNTIRIPVTWGEKVGAAPDYKIDERWMARVKEIISWAYDNDMFVILNTHHEEMTGFEETDKKTTPEDLKYKSGWLRLENYKSSSEELKAIWKQLATEFADYDQHLIFEVLNEPRYADENGIQDWDGDGVTGNSTKVWFDVINKLNADGLNTIRSVKGNEDRAVMLPTYAAQLKEPAISNFEIPNNDKQVIVSIHAYEPYNLCLAKGDQGEEYTTEFTEEGKKLLDEKFALLDKYFINKNIPVVIGETSITNRNNPEDRREWCKYYATLARERTIPLVMWDANKFGKDDPKVGENHGWLNRTLMKWYDKQTTDTLVYTYYGYNVPGDDQYVPEEDLEPTTDKFDIYTVWEDKNGKTSPEPWGQCCDVHINNSCKDIYTGLPANGITGTDLMKEGTMIEIDYDPSQGGAPHLVFFDYRLGAAGGGWVDIYPTDMDEKAGRAYFAYPTLLKTWEGLNGKPDYSAISDIFIAAAFTNVTAYNMKICLPKAGAKIPDPFVDPYETFNFWDKHTVYGPDEGDDSSEVIELPSSSEEESSIESSSEEESSSDIESSSEEESSSETEIIDDTWTGNENITNESPLVLDVNLGDWEDLTVKLNFTTGQYYGGLQIDGANSSNLNNKTSYLPWTTVTGQTSYEYEFKASQLTSDINKLIIGGDQINVTKVEFVGTKKGGAVHTHKYTSKVTKAATCTTDGVRTYTCSCGDSYTEVIKATGHKFGAWTTTTAATCTEDGVQTRTCSVCGEKETKAIAATGHKYVETVVAPTTTEQGYTLHKCSVCGDEYKDNFTDPVKEQTTLGGKVGSQRNSKGALRFIAMISTTDAAGADIAYYDLKVDGKLVERVNVTKTYKSFLQNGKTSTAPAGNNYIISSTLSNLKSGQEVVFELYFSNFDLPLTKTYTVS